MYQTSVDWQRAGWAAVAHMARNKKLAQDLPGTKPSMTHDILTRAQLRLRCVRTPFLTGSAGEMFI